MSRKRKPNKNRQVSGNPRARTEGSGRVTPPKPNKPNKPTHVYSLQPIEPTHKPLEPIPTRETPYRVEGLAIFNIEHDNSEYYLELRDAFAREMKLQCGEYFPDPNIALFYHDLFTESLLSAINSNLFELVDSLQDTLEEYFRDKLGAYSEPEDFDKWDKEILGSFFANRRIVEYVKLGIEIEYDDLLKDGPNPDELEASYCNSIYNRYLTDDDFIFTVKAIGLTSSSISKALTEGYNFDEIVKGVTRQIIAFELFNYMSITEVAQRDVESNILQAGLAGVLVDEEYDQLGLQLNQWGQRAFTTVLHSRLGNDISISFPAEYVMLELLDSYDPKFYQELFSAAFVDNSSELKITLIADKLKEFINDIFDDQELITELEELIEFSLYDMNASAKLYQNLGRAILLDEKWGNKLREIEDSTCERLMKFTFFDPPAVLEVQPGLGL